VYRTTPRVFLEAVRTRMGHERAHSGPAGLPLRLDQRVMDVNANVRYLLYTSGVRLAIELTRPLR
jgi:hypothetical protein